MEIENLEKKLKGELPVTRKELIKLISSWGRNSSFSTTDSIYVYNLEIKKCYDLSNLDVSKVEDMEDIFTYSPYNGDLSKWNVSSCKKMKAMFSFSEFNNDSLKDWDVSKVRNIEFMFYKSKFNGDISSWNVSNVLNMNNTFDDCPFDGDTNEFKKKTAFLFKFFNEIFVSLKQCGLNYVIARQLQFKRSSIFLKTLFLSKKIDSDINKKLSFLFSKWKFNPNVSCYEIFCDNKNFENKYNNGQEIPYRTYDFLEWFKENRIKISNFNVSKEEDLNIDKYLSNFDIDQELKNDR